jgi:hypothetical protein
MILPALWRDVQRLVGALEDDDAEFGFELSLLRAQGRLTDMTGIRRTAEMTMFREANEIAEFPQGHRDRIAQVQGRWVDDPLLVAREPTNRRWQRQRGVESAAPNRQ